MAYPRRKYCEQGPRKSPESINCNKEHVHLFALKLAKKNASSELSKVGYCLLYDIGHYVTPQWYMLKCTSVLWQLVHQTIQPSWAAANS